MSEPVTERTARRPAGSGRARRTRLGWMLVIVGVALALIGGLPPWIRQSYGTDLSYGLHRTGYQVFAGLLALCLVALAGMVATLAVRGVLTRVVAALVAGVGAALAVGAARTWAAPPATAVAEGLGPPAAPDLMGPVSVVAWGPLLVVLGGLAVALGGVLRATGPADRGLSRRYEAPGRQHRPAAAPGLAAAQSAEVQDRDTAADWWKALDAGADPTAPGAPGEVPEPGTPSQRSGRGVVRPGENPAGTPVPDAAAPAGHETAGDRGERGPVGPLP